MPATIYVIVCTDKDNEWFLEITSAYTSRKNAETARNNLKKNFEHHTFTIKPIELKGAVVSRMENNCYMFGMNEK